jgi:hypothetical protein
MFNENWVAALKRPHSPVPGSNTEACAKREYYTSKKGKNSRVSLSIIAFPAFLKCLTALERCVTVPGKMNENSFIIEINSVSSQ